jgi:cell division septation protein DedD
MQSGFSIQLGALGKRPDLNRYSNLNSLNAGDVYVKESGNIFRIRYGVFPDRASADRYLSSVKAKGYRDAYIVPEEGAMIGGSTSPGNTGENPTPPPPVTNNPTQGNYKIQLAALSSTRWFNPSTTILSLGQIEDRRRGNLTIKLLSSFSSMEAAQRALNVVKQNGFPTAFIVLDQNGNLERIRN